MIYKTHYAKQDDISRDNWKHWEVIQPLPTFRTCSFFMFHLSEPRAGTKREVAETFEVKFKFTHFRMYSIFIQANCILPLKPVERNRYLQAWFTGLI